MILKKLKLSVYAPILQSMLSKYQDLYDTKIEGLFKQKEYQIRLKNS